jgi:hypothetical protein
LHAHCYRERMEERFLKLITAQYRLLNGIADSEPLKSKAKEKLLHLVDCLTCIDVKNGSERSSLSREIISTVEIIENYLRLAKDNGYVDDINFFIIIKEYGFLKRSVSILTREMQVKTQTVLNSAREYLRSPVSQSREPYSRRHQIIMNILAVKSQAQVADFQKELNKVTKRTIRRDLDYLLKKGSIKRIGKWNQVFYMITEEHATS